MKILIIDDEMAALTKMKALLAPYGDCTLCTNAAQALQLCTKSIKAGVAFELITIDIQLGDANGNDLLEKINQLELQERAPAAKKLMVTASGTKENLVMAYSKGCNGFLVKPVKRDALEQKMLSLGYAKKSTAA
ncbi:MAG: response regulator [Desulfobacteraceae bacterium]|nr:response regulator [Desulfobacteraceae bacterium]